MSPEEDEWGVMLDDYGFSVCDELDLVLIEGVERGFFNDERVSEELNKLVKNSDKARGYAALQAAWAPLHDSFDDNPNEVAKSIYEGCISNIVYLTPMNLSGAVELLKEIQHAEDARKLLTKYMDVHDNNDIFDLEEDPFGGHVTDPDVVAAFGAKARGKSASSPHPIEAANRIYKGTWHLNDEQLLSALSVDDFVATFKSLKGQARRTFIFGCLQFRSLSNATERQARIAVNAEAALVRIGEESPLNARRLRSYPIKLPASKADF